MNGNLNHSFNYVNNINNDNNYSTDGKEINLYTIKIILFLIK